MPATTIRRTMFNIVADDLPVVRDFYRTLLDMEVIYEAHWYIVLVPREGPRLELGIIARASDVTPPAAAGRPAGGGYLTLIVDEVLVAFEQAKAMDAEILEPPTDMFYGQRRMLVRDPAGTVVDISSPLPTMTA
ncbi:VOC family protein [Chelativorans sp. M5D2P16]|uniref:VOC family protein n=1 Tax=Chelativorans sp. M5D2P16 TaxID=3095678 RepID=UPI002ACA4EEE|nr:VOC family protein [Chelativorans sp. M5D2P16]MDZ5697807.1 VOC family protein [Chelativorans sp. M5D2P16]